MSRTTATIAAVIACLLGLALLAGPAVSTASAKAPQLRNVRANVEVSGHYAYVKVVARTRHTRKLRSPSLYGVRFERAKRHRFVARYSMEFPAGPRARWCARETFVLRGKNGSRARVSERVCFRFKS